MVKAEVVGTFNHLKQQSTRRLTYEANPASTPGYLTGRQIPHCTSGNIGE
jgi:hypothetical protein